MSFRPENMTPRVHGALSRNGGRACAPPAGA